MRNGADADDDCDYCCFEVVVLTSVDGLRMWLHRIHQMAFDCYGLYEPHPLPHSHIVLLLELNSVRTWRAAVKELDDV